MKLKNKKSGETEALRYGAAMEAVAAGTHEIVNEDEGGEEAVEGRTQPAAKAEQGDDKKAQPAAKKDAGK